MRSLNCTEVMARYRKGWAGYTEVYGLRPGGGLSFIPMHLMTQVKSERTAAFLRKML
jgi:hypothetical protein